jgi:hypothetical protein
MAFENSIPSPDILSAEQYSLNNVKNSVPTIDKAIQSSDNKVKLQSDVLALQDQQSDRSDQQKLTAAMSSVDPKSPNYSQDVLKAAQASGMSGKGLLNLQQNLYVADGNKLTLQKQQLEISETVGKMNDEQAARMSTIVDSFHSHLEPLVNDWNNLGAGQNDPTQKALFASRRDASIRQFQDQVNDYVQRGLLDQKTAQTMLAPMLKEIGTPYNPQLTQQEYQKSSDFKAAMDAKREQAQTTEEQARAATAGKQVVTTYGDDNKPHIAVVDLKNNSVTDTGAVGVTKGSGAGGGAPMSQRATDIQAQFALQQIPVPSGVTGIGAQGKAAFFEALGRQMPNATPAEIAQAARAGKLDMVAATKETQTAAGRASQVAGTSVAVFSNGGIADQLQDAAKKTGLSDLKVSTMGKDALSKFYANPDWAQFKEVHGEFTQEMGVILSKGSPAVHGAEEAERMFPMVSSQSELDAQIRQAKQVAQSVESGNEQVIKAIQQHKPLTEVLKATQSSGSSGSDMGNGWSVTVH